MQLTVLALVAVFGVLVATVASDPALPQSGLPLPEVYSSFRHLTRSPLAPGKPQLESAQPAIGRAADGPILRPASPARDHAGTLASIQAGGGERIGFYVNWDAASFSSLKHNLPYLDKLIPEWLHATKANGVIAIDNLEKQTQVLAYLRQNRPQMPIVPLVNNYAFTTEQWERVALPRMLADPVARSRAIGTLLNFVRRIDGAGICVDFEGISLGDPDLSTFMRELSAQFHAGGLEVAQVVPLDDPTANYRALAALSDYLILSVHDERSSVEAGPLASQGWFADALRRRFAELPPRKAIIAIGNYGYDWTGSATPATELPFHEIMSIARESQGRVVFDERALNPRLEYAGDDAQAHHVWFLDAVTAFNQLAEAQRYGPRGFALRRLGSEDPSIWPVFDRRSALDRGAAQRLEVLPPGDAVEYEGRGEILKVTAAPRAGARAVAYNAQFGLILGEQITAYPSAYVITRWGGGHERKIALTFDDGPDVRFTPAVLDVLQHYHVPATFFVIGINATNNGELLRRIVAEGHEIGNHTFTHPNIATISEKQLGVEIHATRRFFESTLGRRSVLFRPPYAVDTEPETPEEVKPLLYTSRLGYYIVEMNIDPTDWQMPGVDKIVQTVLDKAVNHEGNVVLLHDGGTDRSQTVAALPRIIEGLRARGFELVAMSDLLGVTRDAVMPRVGPGYTAIQHINHLGFGLVHWFGLGIHALFIIGLALGIPRPFFVGTLAVIQRWRRHRRRAIPMRGDALSVSVVLPAYNEAKVICSTIQSLLRSTVPIVEIMVVDDGSTDGTADRVVEVFGEEPRVRVFTKSNGGKGTALNYGISHTQADVIIALDADTIVPPDAIEKLVRHFADPRVGAVAGNAKVGNRRTMLARWQALEYVTTQNLERRAFDVLNCITVVPGAVGAWRRDAVLRAGGFAAETIAEDADLTFAILRMGYKVDYEEEAIGLTEAPETVRSLLKQRFRWMFGTLQTVWKHLDTIFRPRYGALGLVAVPYVLVFQIFFSLVAPIVDLFVILTLAVLFWERSQHPLTYSNAGLMRMLAYFALFQAAELLSSILAFLLEPREDRRLLFWVFIQRFFYRQLMYYVGIKTIVSAIKGKLVGWSKFERKATVQVQA